MNWHHESEPEVTMNSNEIDRLNELPSRYDKVSYFTEVNCV